LAQAGVTPRLIAPVLPDTPPKHGKKTIAMVTADTTETMTRRMITPAVWLDGPLSVVGGVADVKNLCFLAFHG
jgi:hypothetical protein